LNSPVDLINFKKSFKACACLFVDKLMISFIESIKSILFSLALSIILFSVASPIPTGGFFNALDKD